MVNYLRQSFPKVVAISLRNDCIKNFARIIASQKIELADPDEEIREREALRQEIVDNGHIEISEGRFNSMQLELHHEPRTDQRHRSSVLSRRHEHHKHHRRHQQHNDSFKFERKDAMSPFGLVSLWFSIFLLLLYGSRLKWRVEVWLAIMKWSSICHYTL